MEDTQYRYYKIAINFGPVRYQNNSKVYEIPEGKSTVLPGLPFTILTFLLGWWGFRVFRSARDVADAVQTNMAGGVDMRRELEKREYDEDVMYVWRNLLRGTQENISIDQLELILILQEEYTAEHPENLFGEENVESLLAKMDHLPSEQLIGIRITEIEDVLDTLKNRESTV